MIPETCRGIGALALFVPMAVEVVKDGGAGQSFATWLALGGAGHDFNRQRLFLQHGNYLLPLGLAGRGIVLTTLLLGARGVSRGTAWTMSFWCSCLGCC